MFGGRGSIRRGSLVVASIGVVLAACGGGGSDASETPDDQARSQPPYEVERLGLELVDGARPTPADGFRDLPERPDRTLPTLVLYPDGDGPFPLVVFAHGHSRAGTEYVDLVSDWVEAGYVVALPTFPLSSGPEATPDDAMSYADVANQPADVSFVIDELLADERLAGRIDGDHVGVVGHSLGAITALGLRNNTCCTDPDVDAVVAVAGMALPLFAGDPVTADAAPLLLIHSAGDPTVPVGGSEGVFADALPPMAFLRYDEGGHDEIFDGGGAQADLTKQAILAFMDDRLRADPAPWKDLPAAVDAAGLGAFEVRD